MTCADESFTIIPGTCIKTANRVWVSWNLSTAQINTHPPHLRSDSEISHTRCSQTVMKGLTQDQTGVRCPGPVPLWNTVHMNESMLHPLTHLHRRDLLACVFVHELNHSVVSCLPYSHSNRFSWGCKVFSTFTGATLWFYYCPNPKGQCIKTPVLKSPVKCVILSRRCHAFTDKNKHCVYNKCCFLMNATVNNTVFKAVLTTVKLKGFVVGWVEIKYMFIRI